MEGIPLGRVVVLFEDFKNFATFGVPVRGWKWIAGKNISTDLYTRSLPYSDVRTHDLSSYPDRIIMNLVHTEFYPVWLRANRTPRYKDRV